MRDISNKVNTLRIAAAEATLKVSPETITLIKENKIPKGNPLEVAKVAAIQAAKNTSQIIPYCHPLPVDFVGVEFEISEYMIRSTVTVKAIYKTGVEMEALTGASVAALTLYDMMKMLDDDMEITGTKLLFKKGGKSDYRGRFGSKLNAAVMVISDSVSAGKKNDLSGRMIVERLEQEKVTVADYKIISDDQKGIEETLQYYAKEKEYDLVVTTGGTGFSPRDNTPEAMANVIEREVPGIPETVRAYGQDRTPYSMLSRSRSGMIGKTLIVNLPGSKKGVADSLDVLFPAVFHAFKMIWGGGHEKDGRKGQEDD